MGCLGEVAKEASSEATCANLLSVAKANAALSQRQMRRDRVYHRRFSVPTPHPARIADLPERPFDLALAGGFPKVLGNRNASRVGGTAAA
jgi:hypothetical protein